MIRAGAMRHRVQLQQRSDSQSSSGEPALTWSLVAEVWASVEPLAGREYFSAQQRGEKVSTRIRMRYRAGVVPRMRIVFDSRWFDIVSVVQVKGIKHELELFADELVEVPTS